MHLMDDSAVPYHSFILASSLAIHVIGLFPFSNTLAIPSSISTSHIYPSLPDVQIVDVS